MWAENIRTDVRMRVGVELLFLIQVNFFEFEMRIFQVK